MGMIPTFSEGFGFPRPSDEILTIIGLGLGKLLLNRPEGKIKAPVDGPVVAEDLGDSRLGYEEPVFVYH